MARNSPFKSRPRTRPATSQREPISGSLSIGKGSWGNSEVRGFTSTVLRAISCTNEIWTITTSECKCSYRSTTGPIQAKTPRNACTGPMPGPVQAPESARQFPTASGSFRQHPAVPHTGSWEPEVLQSGYIQRVTNRLVPNPSTGEDVGNQSDYKCLKQSRLRPERYPTSPTPAQPASQTDNSGHPTTKRR